MRGWAWRLGEGARSLVGCLALRRCMCCLPPAAPLPLPFLPPPQAAGSVVVLFFLSWRLAPVCSIVVVAAGLAAAVYRRHTRDIERRQGSALSRMVTVAAQVSGWVGGWGGVGWGGGCHFMWRTE